MTKRIIYVKHRKITNIEDGNTAEIDVDLKEEKMTGVDNKNVKISIGRDKKEYKSNPNIDKRAV